MQSVPSKQDNQQEKKTLEKKKTNTRSKNDKEQIKKLAIGVTKKFAIRTPSMQSLQFTDNVI